MENNDNTYINSNSDYIIRRGNLCGETVFNIENKNLIYADFSPTHHALQCAYKGGTDEHKQMMELCDQLISIVKKIDTLNMEQIEYLKARKELNN